MIISHIKGHDWVDAQAVFNSPNPVPKSSTHHPIHHGAFLKQVLTCIPDNVEILKQDYVMSDNHERMFGLIVFNTPETANDESWCPTIGIRNSHDQRFPCGLFGGSRVFICDNLAAFGEFSVTRRHTSGLALSLLHLIPNLMNKAVAAPAEMAAEYAAWKEFHLRSVNTLDHLVVESARRDIIPKTMILKVLNEFNKPSYRYDAANDSVFALAQAYTATALRPKSFAQLSSNVGTTIKLRSFINEVVMDAAA